MNLIEFEPLHQQRGPNAASNQTVFVAEENLLRLKPVEIPFFDGALTDNLNCNTKTSLLRTYLAEISANFTHICSNHICARDS